MVKSLHEFKVIENGDDSVEQVPFIINFKIDCKKLSVHDIIISLD